MDFAKQGGGLPQLVPGQFIFLRLVELSIFIQF